MMVHTHVVMISIIVCLAEVTGLDLPDQKSGNERAGSGSYSVTTRPTINECPKDQILHITNGSEEVILTCKASGSDLIGGYWERLNENPIPKENNISTLYLDLHKTTIQLRMAIVRARPVHSGLYYCVVYSRWEMVKSIPTQVNITVVPPIITKQPMTKSVLVLLNVTFTCKAVGFDVKYEWKRIGNNNVIGSESNLTIPEVTPSDKGHYCCIARNDGGHIASDIVTLSVNHIIIVMQSENIIATIGSNVTISVTAKGHNLKYHWKKVHHDSLPSNATGQYSPNLNIPSVTQANDGKYYCIVKDLWGHQIKSSKVILTVIALPVITTHPNSNGPIIVAEGSDVMLRCEATGEGTLNYQWRRLSGSLPDNVQGINTTSLTISNITVSDRGKYFCIVDNGGIGVSSMKVQVTVKVKPVIQSCSQNQELSVVNDTVPVALICEFEGDDIIAGYCLRGHGDKPFLFFSNADLNQNETKYFRMYKARPYNSGEYHCVVYSHWGVARSRIIRVNITVAPPKIIVHPSSKTISVLEDVILTCEAEGVEVKYKWRRYNGTIRSEIINQRNLTIHQVIPSDDDLYYCVATNKGGTNVSKNAKIAINELKLKSNLTVGKGSDVKLNCNTDYQKVLWHIVRQDNISNTITDSSSLMSLTNISETESGHYQCAVNVSGEVIESNWVTIKVFGLEEELNDIIVTSGSIIVLRCKVSVTTAVRCTWKHNGIVINTNCSDHSLTLKNVSLSDEGSYTCEMTGNSGKPVKSTAKLELLYVSIYPPHVSVVEESNIDFTCLSSISSSTMTTQWLHNGTIMENENNAVLHLLNVKRKDGGVYYCIVTINNASAKSNSAQLHPVADTVNHFINYVPPRTTVVITSEDDNTARTVGIIFGSIFGFIICCCCTWCCAAIVHDCCCCCRRRKLQSSIDLPELERATTEPADTPHIDRPLPLLELNIQGKDEKLIIEVSTNDHQNLMDVIYMLQPEMEKLLNIDELLPYLMRHHVLTNNEEQHLGPSSYKTSLEKARYLLSDSVLGSKGPEGERNFIKALYESSKELGNTGNEELVIQLRTNGVVITEKPACGAL